MRIIFHFKVGGRVYCPLPLGGPRLSGRWVENTRDAGLPPAVWSFRVLIKWMEIRILSWVGLLPPCPSRLIKHQLFLQGHECHRARVAPCRPLLPWFFLPSDLGRGVLDYLLSAFNTVFCPGFLVAEAQHWFEQS